MYCFHLCFHRQLANIKEVQTAINSHDFVCKVLPHIARRSDAIVREVLAFLSLMLFNANRDVQVYMFASDMFLNNEFSFFTLTLYFYVR